MWVDAAMREVKGAALFPANTHALIMDEEALAAGMTSVTRAFDDAAAADGASAAVRFLHSFAVKANPLEGVLRVAERCGFGAETASIGEFVLAERVFATTTTDGDTGENVGGRIVFDSPAKTLEELHYALQRRCYLNVDNFAELDRIVALVDGKVPGFTPIPTPRAIVGVRVNPQTVTATSNAALATGGAVSKFGVALHDPGNKEELVRRYLSLHEKINLLMVHVHSGSQGLSIDTMVAGVRAIVQELVDEPRLAAAGIINVVDIGGGFPVDFASDDPTVTITDYTAALRAHVPSLFRPTQQTTNSSSSNNSNMRTIITEFGRSIAAKAGVLVSRVEYTKMSGGRQIILQHIGADLAVRTVWQPEKWPLRVAVYDADGNNRCAAVSHLLLKAGSGGAAAAATTTPLPAGFVLTDVAGPCCNSGCTLIRATPMPADVAPLSDVVVVRDVGAYYHSSFSLYNLRQMPACYMRRPRREGGAGHEFVCMKARQTIDATLGLFTLDSTE
uniref:Diaminopimelate decarboxylase n=1 Tax=Herpetomonas muscarum TaxID=5718 RepID=U5KL74_HERMU|nr:diaminopimelate decarboxylase [Herpetomonas muscarum]